MFIGAVGALQAQQPLDPPLSSSMKDRMEQITVTKEKSVPNASIASAQGEKPLSDFRKGGSSQMTASEVMGLSSALRQAVLSDLSSYNVSKGNVSKNQVEMLSASEQAIVGQHPSLFVIENKKEDQR